MISCTVNRARNVDLTPGSRLKIVVEELGLALEVYGLGLDLVVLVSVCGRSSCGPIPIPVWGRANITAR